MSEHVIRQDKDKDGFYTEPVTSNQNTVLYTVRGREDFVDQTKTACYNCCNTLEMRWDLQQSVFWSNGGEL